MEDIEYPIGSTMRELGFKTRKQYLESQKESMTEELLERIKPRAIARALLNAMPFGDEGDNIGNT